MAEGRPRTRRAEAQRRTAISRCAAGLDIARSADRRGRSRRDDPIRRTVEWAAASHAGGDALEDGLDALDILHQGGALQR